MIMARDWGLSGAWHGLQSRSAFHNPGCAIRANMEHVRYFRVFSGEASGKGTEEHCRQNVDMIVPPLPGMEISQYQIIFLVETAGFMLY